MHIAGRASLSMPIETRLAASRQRETGQAPSLPAEAMPKIHDLGKPFPALQGCFQSREEAVTKVGIWRACTASAGLLLEILAVGTVFLGDAAYSLVPRNHPGHDQRKYQARGQHSHGRFAKIAPVQPEGEVDFEGERAQERNRRVHEREKGKNLGEAASHVSP